MTAVVGKGGNTGSEATPNSGYRGVALIPRPQAPTVAVQYELAVDGVAVGGDAWTPLGNGSTSGAPASAEEDVRTSRAHPFARRRLGARAVFFADVVGLTLSFSISKAIVPVEVGAMAATYAFGAVVIAAWVLAALFHGITDPGRAPFESLGRTFHVVTLATWVSFGLLSFVVALDARRTTVFWATAMLLVPAVRATSRAFWKDSLLPRRTLIVGAGDVGHRLARKLLRETKSTVVVGFVDAEPRERSADLDTVDIIGVPEDLPRLIQDERIDRVIIAFSLDSPTETLRILRSVKHLDVEIDIVPRLYELVGPRAQLRTVEGMPLVNLPIVDLSRAARTGKRALDLIIAAVGLAFLAPTFALVMLLIKLDSPGPVFFRQLRMGAGDRTFRLLKFRTMLVDADERKPEVIHLNKHAKNGGDPRMFKVPDDPRVTRVGRFLRQWSLDELPQLINVLRGDMTLVGPRPLILDEDRYVTSWGRERLSLKPGMTGIWQVAGRNDIPFDEMVTLDYLYVTNWSLALDLKLLAQTVPAVLTARGVD